MATDSSSGFFFSSRRRHTRFDCDWSSDVCSSDLIDFSFIDQLGDELKQVAGVGVQLGLVVGGGNILRGTAASEQGMDRVSADYMGMLATVINALALQDILEKKGVDTRVMTAIRMEELAEPYIRRR